MENPSRSPRRDGMGCGENNPSPAPLPLKATLYTHLLLFSNLLNKLLHHFSKMRINSLLHRDPPRKHGGPQRKINSLRDQQPSGWFRKRTNYKQRSINESGKHKVRRMNNSRPDPYFGLCHSYLVLRITPLSLSAPGSGTGQYRIFPLWYSVFPRWPSV
jgi:hypothetical protein